MTTLMKLWVIYIGVTALGGIFLRSADNAGLYVASARVGVSAILALSAARSLAEARELVEILSPVERQLFEKLAAAGKPTELGP